MVGKFNKIMKNPVQLNVLLKQFYKDNLVICTVVFVIFLTISLSCFVSFFLGFITLICFGTGCCLAILLLRKFQQIENVFTKVSKIFNPNNTKKRNILDKCDVCGIKKCARHQQTGLIIKEPWKGMFIDKDLDVAVDMFFTKILADFIESWYTLLSSNDEDFILTIKQNIREAICRLIIKIKEVNIPELLSNKFIPHILCHYHLIHQWLADGVPMDRLPKQFQQTDQKIHPAVLNRTTEIEYLRSIAKCLLVRLCDSEHLDSKIFFTLTRELLAHHVLLPLMDVIADPNLINLLAILATNNTKINIPQINLKNRVIFLEEFVNRKSKSIKNQPITVQSSHYYKQDKENNEEDEEEEDNEKKHHKTVRLVTPLKSTAVLNDQDHLYAFMQFLKKENVVDILRFYLDVEGLNNDLLDPKVTTDPAKLSTLQQYSEKLLKSYHLIIERYHLKVPIVAETLNDAHSNVKYILLGKYQREFRKKVDYFRLVYGSREIKEMNEGLDRESETTAGFSISSKLKGALRLAIDGAPLDGTEIPTVWDTFHDDSNTLPDVTSSTGASPSSTNTAQGSGGNQLQNPKIYSGVTHKLRKERGQHLENFIAFFMQSIEYTTDIGEDVVTDDNNEDIETLASTDKFKRNINSKRKITPSGHNFVFGDLFELRKLPNDRRYNPHTSSTSSFSPLNGIKGTSVCLIYILVNILNTPRILVRILLGLISVSKNAIDSLVNKLLGRLILFGVSEPHLTILMKSLTEHIFEKKLGGKDDLVSPSELLERQRQAKQRLENVWKGLSNITDVLQSPPLNKHLMYCLLDIILIELYPELEKVD